MPKPFPTHPILPMLVIGLVLAVFTPYPLAMDKPTMDKPTLAKPPGTTRVVIACEENVGQDHDDYYYSRLLKLVLTKTVPTHGDFEIHYAPVMPINKRLLREIERGAVDVTWMPYARNLEYAVTPIKIRLLKNLSDYRVFLIRAEDAEKFSKVKSLDDLRRFKGGIGSHWPDRQVMEDNNLPLVLSMSYFNLFKMLKSNRFDYFSRGVYQVRSEVEAYSDHGIVLDKHLFLRYDNPVYFYVSQNNRSLAERIETGLKLAIEDGSFNDLFNHVENLQWGAKLLEGSSRTVIQLQTQSE